VEGGSCSQPDLRGRLIMSRPSSALPQSLPLLSSGRPFVGYPDAANRGARLSYSERVSLGYASALSGFGLGFCGRSCLFRHAAGPRPRTVLYHGPRLLFSPVPERMHRTTAAWPHCHRPVCRLVCSHDSCSGLCSFWAFCNLVLIIFPPTTPLF